MKFKVVYISLAKDDLKKAIDYYKDISPKLAKDFIFRIREGKIILAKILMQMM